MPKTFSSGYLPPIFCQQAGYNNVYYKTKSPSAQAKICKKG
jgi:hypothetical protein